MLKVVVASTVKIALLGVLMGVDAGAEGVPSAPSSSQPAQTNGVTAQPVEKPLRAEKKKVKGRVRREKEAEGTQAPNRFESDITIKSRYQYGGQSLEVDTD